MRKLYLLLNAILLATVSQAQITITASDMPVNGDTLRYSLATPLPGSVNLNDTGANNTWTFNFTPIFQGIDEYQTAIKVNATYALTISPTAYGYKVADSLPIPGLGSAINVKEIYNFFNKKSSPSRFVTEAFAAKISGLPIPANYSDEDEVYFFPLAYGNKDSSDFFLNVSIPTIGSLKMDGYRKTVVDGWGTISTPFYTTPVNCIRLRSEVVQVDSVQVTGLPAIGLPRTTIDYKWLVNGDHYPALWVTTSVVANVETITAIRYRDKYRSLSVAEHKPGAAISTLNVYPNPAGDVLNIGVPNNYQQYLIEVFDVQGKLITTVKNTNTVNTSALASGNYVVRLTSVDGVAYAQFSK